ncbi:hypothetical protein M8J76_017033 [Diaphorina citri]|nr:hypothetical protein M8J75_005619 [Diaphorina citri]KAI5746081.1 hypothetical protein M8J76_017033 [Diaphorina citri]KAI5751776.1 hypothetical protein M8J77_010756 [Diaphorina citri]
MENGRDEEEMFSQNSGREGGENGREKDPPVTCPGELGKGYFPQMEEGEKNGREEEEIFSRNGREGGKWKRRRYFPKMDNGEENGREREEAFPQNGRGIGKWTEGERKEIFPQVKKGE